MSKIKRNIAILTPLLICLLMVIALSNEAWAGIGRNNNYGYWKNIRDDYGTDVISGGIKVTSKDAFITKIKTLLNGSNQSKTGASFIICTMLGYSAGNGCSQRQTVDGEQYKRWEALVTAYSDAGRVNWNAIISASTSQLNSYWQATGSGSNPDDVAMGTGHTGGGAIIFYNESNSPIYTIRKDCGNPIGNLAGLPDIPKEPEGSAWDTSAQSRVWKVGDAEPSATGNRITVYVGDTVRFRHMAGINQPSQYVQGSVNSATWSATQNSNGGGFTANVGSGTITTTGAGINIGQPTNDVTVTNAGEICQRVGIAPSSVNQGTPNNTPLNSAPACVTVQERPSVSWNTNRKSQVEARAVKDGTPEGPPTVGGAPEPTIVPVQVGKWAEFRHIIDVQNVQNFTTNAPGTKSFTWEVQQQVFDSSSGQSFSHDRWGNNSDLFKDGAYEYNREGQPYHGGMSGTYNITGDVAEAVKSWSWPRQLPDSLVGKTVCQRIVLTPGSYPHAEAPVVNGVLASAAVCVRVEPAPWVVEGVSMVAREARNNVSEPVKDSSGNPIYEFKSGTIIARPGDKIKWWHMLSSKDGFSMNRSTTFTIGHNFTPPLPTGKAAIPTPNGLSGGSWQWQYPSDTGRMPFTVPNNIPGTTTLNITVGQNNVGTTTYESISFAPRAYNDNSAGNSARASVYVPYNYETDPFCVTTSGVIVPGSLVSARCV